MLGQRRAWHQASTHIKSYLAPHTFCSCHRGTPLWKGKRAPIVTFGLLAWTRLSIEQLFYSLVVFLWLWSLIVHGLSIIVFRIPTRCVTMWTWWKLGHNKVVARNFDAGQALSAQAVHFRKTKVGSSLCFLPRFYAFLRVEYAVPVSPFPR